MAGQEGKKAQGGKPQQPQTPKQQKGDQAPKQQTPKQQQPQTPKQQQQKGEKPQTPKQPQPQTPKQQQKVDQQKPQTPKPQTPKQKPEAAEPKQKKEQTPQQKKVTPTKELVPVHNHDHDDSDDELDLAGLPRSSFWAAEVEPRKAISKDLYFPIKLKQVVLAPNAAANKVHTLYVVVEDKKWPLAVLGQNQHQVLLNVTFDAGLSITLLSESDATFYVYGNYFQDYDEGGFSDDEDEDEINFDSEEEDDDEDEDESEDSEIDQKVIASLNKRKAEANKPAPSAKAAAQPVKKQKNNEAEAVPKAQAAKQQPKAAAEPQPSPVQTLSNGLKIQDLTVGKGSKPTKGKEVVVGYVGRLTNGRVFDRSANFKFRLGIGEVIKGWDLGVATMQVGGKRRLTVPGELAYGKRGAPPDIPPNATLIFDIDLKRA